ncbi:class I SAM-dependent methyltransferase [[Pseudomonas] carboxydohydrogena]|uniref:Class I SAM-dependent methyltransferase n=1 Tax=Afipia carboxydohydrogena TaxID=290 RepID=A0ABY8BM95_AFICR|nr:class I SAM-dependent methyltransferase [[Pseudomonas] carboxydohydrogena]WEF50606.1 class I SAM-dependent methyltransferase [[Pseudomonas] carboxydohydrogena]
MITSTFNYYFSHIDDVDGWLDKTTAIISNRLMQHQSAVGLTGPVCGIGVHHGKYFVALACGLRPNEKGIAIDLFENRQENIGHSGLGDRGMFDRNVARFLYPPSITVISADSTGLSAGDISRHGAVRFFSVNGRHTEAVTLSNLRLAERSIATGGIVALDGILHQGWTGVISGYVRYRQAGGRLRAFALVPNKLLLTDEGSAASYRNFMRRQFARIAGQRDMEFIGDIVDLYAPAAPSSRFGFGPLSWMRAKLGRKSGNRSAIDGMSGFRSA